VFGFFALFLDAGKRMSLVPGLFVSTILVSGLLGAAVAGLYSEPMNRVLRRGWGSDSNRVDRARQDAGRAGAV
jgi:hypothetical protein